MDKFDLFLLMQKPIINGYILSKITADGKFYFAPGTMKKTTALLAVDSSARVRPV